MRVQENKTPPHRAFCFRTMCSLFESLHHAGAAEAVDLRYAHERPLFAELHADPEDEDRNRDFYRDLTPIGLTVPHTA